MSAERYTQTIGSCLGDTGVDTFLKDFWQKKPLLIRQAFPDLKSYSSSLPSADELAGLACEDHVNARLVIENPEASATGDKPWLLEHGPFDESRFSELPVTNWSLLVSDVERHLPDSRFLLNHFHFIPDWRIDDLMISYAPAGGSVGAHIDAYDVFLVQLNGQRHWQISEDFADEIIEGIDLSILRSFTAEQGWILDAGDMLYLPPNVAHLGIACDCRDDNGDEIHCMTASVGFRAPSLKTISADFIDFSLDRLGDARYRDDSPAVPQHHAEISEQTIDRFERYLRESLSIDRERLRQWIGEFSSDNRTFEDIVSSMTRDDDITYKTIAELAKLSPLMQSPYSNYLYSHTTTDSMLFIDGVTYHVSREFAEMICAEPTIDFETLTQVSTDEDRKVLVEIYKAGAIIQA